MLFPAYPWTRRPPLGTKVRKIPFLNSVLLAVGNSFVDVARGRMPLEYITTPMRGRDNDQGPAVLAISAGYMNVPGVNPGNRFSRLAIVAKRDGGNVMGISDTAVGVGGAGWYITNTESLTLDKNSTIGIVSASLPALDRVGSRKTDVVGVTYDGATGRLFHNGALVAEATPAAQTFTRTGGYLFRGSSSTSGPSAANEMNLHADWTEALSIGEMCAYTANPWLLFEPMSAISVLSTPVIMAGNRRRRFFIGAAA